MPLPTTARSAARWTPIPPGRSRRSPTPLRRESSSGASPPNSSARECSPSATPTTSCSIASIASSGCSRRPPPAEPAPLVAQEDIQLGDPDLPAMRSIPLGERLRHVAKVAGICDEDARAHPVSGRREAGLELAARVVKCLIERPRGRVEAPCEILGRHAIDRERDQDLALARGEALGNQATQRLGGLLGNAELMRRFGIHGPHPRVLEPVLAHKERVEASDRLVAARIARVERIEPGA